MLTTFKKTLFILLGLICLGSVAAEGGAIEITGRAVSSEGAGLARARVTLLEAGDGPAVTTTSDAGGRFRLEAPAAGMYTLLVEASGRVPWEQALALFEPMDLPTVTLAKAAVLEIEIRGDDGQPLADAWLEIDGASRYSQQKPASGDWVPSAQRQRADAEGRLALWRPVVKTPRLLAWAPGWLEGAVVAGKRKSLEIVLQRGVGRVIEVRDESGSPLGGVLARVGEGRWPAGRTGPDGRLELAAPANGELLLELDAEDGRRLRSRLLPTAPASAATGPGDAVPEVFYLHREALAGRVLAAPQGEPLAGAWVWIDDARSDFTRTGTDGGFSLPVDGRLDGALLWATAPGHLRQRVELGGRQHLDPDTSLEIALRPALRLAGRVVDEEGRGVAGAEIQAHADLSRNHFLEPPLAVLARSDENGHFALSQLAASPTHELIVRASGFAAMIFEVSGTREGAGEARLVLRRGQAATGRVEDAFGRPVAGAGVVLYPSRATRRERLLVDDVHVAQSRADGSFAMRHVLGGPYDLGVTAPGFAPLEVPGLEIAEDGAALDLGTVVLEPEAVLYGRVTDPDDEPLRGVEVSFLSMAYDVGPGEDRLSTLDVTRSNVDGEFVLRGLEPGRPIDLKLARAGYQPREVFGVEVGGGETPVFTLEPAALLAGQVVDRDGAAVAGARITLRPQTAAAVFGEAWRGVTANGAGRFLIDDLEPGLYTLGATADGYLAATPREVEVRASQAVDGLSVVLTPGARLAGRVEDAAGRPVRGAKLTVLEPPPPPATARVEARSRADGSYELDGLATGLLVLEITHAEHPRAVRKLEIRDGFERLDLTLESGFEVTGRVLDDAGAPVVGARLRLRGVGQARKNATSEADGRFRFAGLVAGDYEVRAAREGYAEAQAELRLEAGGVTVQPLELRLGAGGTVTGRLLGLEPAEIARAKVVALDASGRRVSGTVDWQGQYRIEHLAPGEWTVDAAVGTETGRRADERVEIEAGVPETYVDLDFTAGLVVTGEVRRGGALVSGALVSVVREDLGATRGERTDPAGRFRLSGLAAGSWQLIVRDLDSGQFHHRRLELEADRDMVVELEPVTSP